jgi:hypothetical protein
MFDDLAQIAAIVIAPNAKWLTILRQAFEHALAIPVVFFCSEPRGGEACCNDECQGCGEKDKRHVHR